MFAGYVPLASQSPYPIIVYFLANYRPHPLFGKCNFRDPNLVTFYLCIYLINVVSSGGMWCGQCGLIIKFNKQQLSDFFLTENLPILNPYLPQNLKICDPILVTLLKMRPHPAAHPHYPLVREYPPPPRTRIWHTKSNERTTPSKDKI